jgi:cell division protein FtsW
MYTRYYTLFLLRMLLIVVCILLIIGIIFVYSASSVFALATYGSVHYYFKRHLFGIIIGSCAFGIVQIIPTILLQRISPFLFYSAFLLSAATLLPRWSCAVHGSSRWLSLFGFTFQPSELLKVTLPLYTAYLLAKSAHRHRSYHTCYILLLCIVGATSIVLLKQPDFGLTMTLLMTMLIMLFLIQCNIKHIIYGICSLVGIGISLIAMRPYRIKRLLVFLDPWHDPQGAGFQIIQSLIAISTGHWTGIGISGSKQKFFYVPMQHTDFIFSIIADETGFLGCLVLICLYLTFLYLGLTIGLQLRDFFAQYVTIAYTILISLQVIINLAVTTGLVPTKGIGLPFISYGNTALVCAMMMIGIITRMTREL